MAVALKKESLKAMFVSKKIMKLMETISISKFCFIFTLRQGTIMIATIELSLSAFALILLSLCLTHANRLLEMVTVDIKQFEDDVLRQKGDDEPPAYAFSNEEKMLIGRHLALILKMIVYVILLAAVAYFVSCVLLMYGAIRRSPCHLLPWICVAFVSLASVLLWFIPFCFFIPESYCFLACMFSLVLYPLEIYSWLTVFSYYRQLTFKRFNKVDAAITSKVCDP